MSIPISTSSPRNIAARMGRWSAQHRKAAIFGWLAFVILAVAIGAGVGTNDLKEGKSGSGESGHVESILTDHFKQPQQDAVLVQSRTLTVDDARFQAAIIDVVRTTSGMSQVRDVRSPLGAGRAGEISKDRHSARVVIELRTTDPERAKTVDGPVAAALSDAGTRHPGIAIEEFGGHSMKQFDDAVSDDFTKAGEFSLPVTLIVLVIAFGALVAAGLPLLLALTAVVATGGLLALPSKLMPLDPQVGVIVLLIGLAVGVDYAMFYLKREREERAPGPQCERGGRGRSRHLGAAVHGLRHHGDRRHGRHAVHRRQDVHELRCRGDARGRRRRDRLAHRPAGDDALLGDRVESSGRPSCTGCATAGRAAIVGPIHRRGAAASGPVGRAGRRLPARSAAPALQLRSPPR